jgi:Cu2+-exporting ATPase
MKDAGNSAPMHHGAATPTASRPAAQAGRHEVSGHAPHDRHEGHRVEDFRRRFWISLALTLPILALTPLIQGLLGLGDSLRFPGDGYLLFALSTLIFLYGGFPFLQGLVRELSAGLPGMMTLIALAISTAYLYSAAVSFGLPGMVFYWELATLLDIMLLGHWIEMRSVLGASRALEELARLMPSEAHRLRADGSTEEVGLELLRVGDRVLVRPGEKVPADGEVREGRSSLNQAMLTGESQPVDVQAGAAVVGGAINGEGSLVVEIRKPADSYLSQVIQLVREAQASKSRTQDRRAGAPWLTIVAWPGRLTLFAWLALAGRELSFALERAVTVMVIACPHALGLAIPLVVAVSTAQSARRGLLIRNRTAFEQARHIGAVIFDKTGTLTEGRFAVTDTLLLDGAVDKAELLRYAASVEAHSEHPLARGVAGAADRTFAV